MPPKLESLFKRTTGVNPNLLDPKPSGKYMQNTIRRMREASGKGGDGAGKTLFQNPDPDPIFFLERVENTSEGPLTVIGRKLESVTEYAILFNTGLGVNDIQREASLIPPGDWFTLDQAAL